MNKSFKKLFVRLASLVLLTGIATAAEATDAERLAASHVKWHKAKEECGGSYSYKVTRVSFTGEGNETIVVVKENKVAERRFRTFSGRRSNEAAPMEWVETGKDIGSHKEGAVARTMDELYAVAGKIAEEKVAGHQVRSLGFDEKGLLQYCFLRDTRIADDAPLTGVSSIQLTLGTK